jgi:hypoxanthine-DNA glycosylase
MTEQAILIEEGFKPILGREPRVLVLGTMPSVQSLKTQQYYGHPRNAFWWIMSELCGFDFTLPYNERVACLLTKNIAVWDVIASCHRPGSLDSKIDQSTVTPNYLPALLKKYSSLKLIVFNGQAAEKLFKKFIGNDSWQGDKIVLPSTSPANAVFSKEQKLAQWAQIQDYLAD